jgi:hypothetical protein
MSGRVLGGSSRLKFAFFRRNHDDASGGSLMSAVGEPILASSDHPGLRALRSNIDFGVVSAFCGLFGEGLKVAHYSPHVRALGPCRGSLPHARKQRLEQDLAGLSNDPYAAYLCSKLLAALTGDRTLKLALVSLRYWPLMRFDRPDHFLPRLRREFMRRSPEKTYLLGLDKVPAEEQRDWSQLTASDKVRPFRLGLPLSEAAQVQVLHAICDWFFMDADKMREKLGATEADGQHWVSWLRGDLLKQRKID